MVPMCKHRSSVGLSSGADFFFYTEMLLMNEEIFSRLLEDEVGMLCRSDTLITEFGFDLFGGHINDTKEARYIVTSGKNVTND